MTERPKREKIMLAHPASEKGIMKLGSHFFAQPKLNGERCRVEWFHDEPILLSSYGNEFKFLNHIKEALTHNFKHYPLPLDGELYVHGWSRERIHSACSRKVNDVNPDTPLLQFHVFDYQGEDSSQWQRIHELERSEKMERLQDPLIYVPYKVTSGKDWLDLAYEYTQEGYEGIILRSPIASYERKRSQYMLKFKPTEEDEYTIFSTAEAISKEGNPKGMIGSFQVCADDGTVFSVGAGKLSHTKRTMLWRDRKDLIGKKLLVKHELIKTVGGIPICSVAVEVIEQRR